jgi:PIN domain nuclease of toxin-antitoxin system
VILLDTCTLLWLARGDGLPPAVVALLADERNAVFVSAISAWEIGVKSRKGRLHLPMPLLEWWRTIVDHHGLGEVPIEPELAIRATELPLLHADPADRLLVATALHLRATLLTPDPLIHAYPDVTVAWG